MAKKVKGVMEPDVRLDFDHRLNRIHKGSGSTTLIEVRPPGWRVVPFGQYLVLLTTWFSTKLSQ